MQTRPSDSTLQLLLLPLLSPSVEAPLLLLLLQLSLNDSAAPDWQLSDMLTS
jgi:hypothetical protein